MVEESRDVLKRGTWHPIKDVARERTPAAYRIALKLRAQTARALRRLHGLPQLTWRTNGSLPYLSEARQLQALVRTYVGLGGEAKRAATVYAHSGSHTRRSTCYPQ